ncbi:MAG: hypothetical protein ACKOC5_15655 [Chloroflexota bacterium]
MSISLLLVIALCALVLIGAVIAVVVIWSQGQKPPVDERDERPGAPGAGR